MKSEKNPSEIPELRKLSLERRNYIKNSEILSNLLE
jgi:hypothetical protein